MPSALRRRIEKLMSEARKERGTKWSQNDQIVLMLERAAEEGVR
jgi:hypothetical protein